jgi:hypothetical protein
MIFVYNLFSFMTVLVALATSPSMALPIPDANAVSHILQARKTKGIKN